MNGRKNKIVFFRFLVPGGGGGGLGVWECEIYVDMDIVTKFRKEANE
jgi:hypothetical protein